MYRRIAASLWVVILAILLQGLRSSVAFGEDVKMLEIGAAAPDFDLPGIDGKRFTLKDFADAKILVIIFTSNHCPTAQAYEPRIKQMTADYKAKGVAVVGINPNNPDALTLDELRYTDVNDSLEDMKIRAKDQAFNFPYLYDGDSQKIAHAYGVQATPHVFIFDQDRKLRYVGRIDDSEVKTVHHHDATDAIDALLAGKPVPVEKTHVFGCSTKWISKSDNARHAIEAWDKEPVDLKPIDAAAVKSLAANDSKNLRLINVWATWCGPCVNELPELVTIQRIYRQRGFEVVTISMDDLARKEIALKFLNERHVSGTNYLYAADDKDALVNALDPNWEGPVPFTVLVAPGGKVLYRHSGPFDDLELKRAIVGIWGGPTEVKRSLRLYMSAILHYQTARTEQSANPRRGRTAAVVAIVSGLGIICLSHQCRMSMVVWKGEWCGNPRANGEFFLYATGFLLFVPAAASWTAWHAKSGFVVCRTSLAAALMGWLFYVISAFVGLAL